MIDTHAHLTDNKFASDYQLAIDRAFKNDLICILTISSNLDDCKAASLINAGDHRIGFSAGVHPHEASKWNSDSMQKLQEYCPKAHAIGEIGLDFHYNFSPPNIQRKAFIEQLKIAQDVNLPVIIHSREAYDEIIDILASIRVEKRGVVHSFTGSFHQANQLLELGYFLSFNGMLTFKNAKEIQSIFGQLSPDRVLLETDCPYLAPEPIRGRRNEPSFIRYIYDKAAQIWNLDFQDVLRINRSNAWQLFKFGIKPEHQTIFYPVRKTLYINLTNKCLNSCTYCLKDQSDFYLGYNLRFSSEPSLDAIISELDKFSVYENAVFCGFGEPLLRIEDLFVIAQELKKRQIKVRINTSGLLSVRPLARDFHEKLNQHIDCIEISLGNATPQSYAKTCRPSIEYPETAFNCVHQFIADCMQMPNIKKSLSCVNAPGIDLEGCKQIAAHYQLPLKIRNFKLVRDRHPENQDLSDTET